MRVDNVCLDFPRVVSAKDILKTLNLDLNPGEEKQLYHSVKVLQEVLNSLVDSVSF